MAILSIGANPSRARSAARVAVGHHVSPYAPQPTPQRAYHEVGSARSIALRSRERSKAAHLGIAPDIIQRFRRFGIGARVLRPCGRCPEQVRCSAEGRDAAERYDASRQPSSRVRCARPPGTQFRVSRPEVGGANPAVTRHRGLAPTLLGPMAPHPPHARVVSIMRFAAW